jgi:uncharacterized protein YegJ (DUF2314 family)
MRRTCRLSLLALGFVVGVGGCGLRRTDNDILKRPDQPDITYVPQGDPEMKQAENTARKTVGQFIAAMKSPKPNQTDFSIKAEFKDGETKEFMWLNELHFDGVKFTGKLNNVPEAVKNLKLGDEVSVPKDQIADWMYAEDGDMVGGYSIRVLDERSKR